MLLAETIYHVAHIIRISTIYESEPNMYVYFWALCALIG
jgi:hypothetical protein